MSFVLAMVLSVGLGSSKLFAENFDASGDYQYANSQSYSWTETTSSSTAKGQNNATSSQQTGRGFLIEFGSADDRLSGNLSGIFKYYAGSMVGYEQAGGNYYLYDSYGQRGVLSSAGGEHFSLESWNFRTSDLAKMDNLKTVDQWNSYLKSIGFSGEQLRRMKFDEQGNPAGTVYTKMGIKKGVEPDTIKKSEYNKDTDTYYYWTTTEGTGDEEKTVYHRVKKNDAEVADENTDYATTFTDTSIGDNGIEYQSMSLGLFSLLKETLSQGSNYAATLAVGDGANGMSLTIYKNSKPRQTYVSYDPVNTGKGNNSNPKAAQPFGTSYSDVRCVSEVLYTKGGMQYGTRNFTFEFDSTTANDKEQKVGVGGHWAASDTYINFDDLTGVRYDTTFNKVSLKDGSFTWSKDGNKVTGSINNTATRANMAMASSVMKYSFNGSRFEQINNEKQERTYLADNQMSVTYNKENTLIAKVGYTQNGVQEQAWYSDNTEDSNHDRGGTYYVSDYWGRQDSAWNDTNGSNFGSHAHAQAMLNQGKQYKRNLIEGKSIGNVGGLKSVNWYEEDIKKIASIPVSQRSAAINKIFDAKSMTTMLNFSNGVAALASTSIADATWDENIPEDAVYADDADVTSETKNETDRTQGVATHKDKTVTKTSGKGYAFTTTINAGGSAAFETKCNIVTQAKTVTTNYYIDPAIEGNIITDKAKLAEIFGVDPDSIEVENGVVTIDGVSYVAVNAAEINMMDGSGFQASNGEVVVVQLNSKDKDGNVSGLSKEKIQEIKDKVASGDTSVMFMGNIREDVEGNMAITVDTSYGGGVELANIDDVKEQITLASLGAAIEKGVITLEAFNETHGTSYTKEDVANAVSDEDNEWAIKNTNANIEQLEKAGFDFTQGNGIEKIKDAWNKLLKDPEEMQKYF